MKPILFNTDMVRAILDGQKSVTRRVVKPQPKMQLFYCGGYGCGRWSYPPKNCVEQGGWDEKYRRIDGLTAEDNTMFWTPPFHAGDILYVRETWDNEPVSPGGHTRLSGVYYYKADGDLRPEGWRGNWHPSIHMPKEAARIFLRVTDVHVERLQDMTEDDAFAEGFDPICPYEHRIWVGSPYNGGYASMCWAEGDCHNPERWCDKSVAELFGINVWNSTIKKSDLPVYGWEANPWVWVIEFKRISEEEAKRRPK